jgi:hypothetical protein
MKKPFVLCVVTYYPEDHLKVRLAEALLGGYFICVYDNTPGGCGWNMDAGLTGIHWLGKGENDGMGKGLSSLLTEVMSLGYDSAFYVDQDTHFGLDTLDWLSTWMQENAVLVSRYAALNFLPRKRVSNDVEPVALMVSAGTLFSLSAMEVIGVHSAQWFLECVDYEWCGRALKAGYTLGRVGGCIGLDHARYQPQESVHFMGATRVFRCYPWKRTRAFLSGLLWLGIRGIKDRQRVFAWACFRNALTHGVDQMRAWILWGIKLGKGEKA